MAWLSLEEDDRQPAAFWTYRITALGPVVPGAGVDALALLTAPQPQIQPVLATDAERHQHRADPALPLSRLRAYGELVELRSSDLRFTGEEVAGDDVRRSIFGSRGHTRRMVAPCESVAG